MVLSRQDIIKQIQQGKIQAALEGMVQLSGQTRDKDLQQRCVLLQGQLAQLNSKLGLGTLDNASYQLGLNRIAQTTLEAAYDLPATLPNHSTAQQTQARYQPQTSSSNSSGWKTWGILLTGGVGVIIFLGVLGTIMEDNGANDTSMQHSLQPIQTNGGAGASLEQPEAATLNTAAPTRTVSQANIGQKFVGNWDGMMDLGGISIGGLQIQLMPDNRYISRMYDTTSGALMAPIRGVGVQPKQDNWC